MKRSHGFTLIELLLVLGILAAVMGGAFWLFQEVSFQRAVTMEGKNVQTVVASITGASEQFRSTTYLGADYAAKSAWNMNLPNCGSGWCNDFGSVTRVLSLSCWSNKMGPQHVFHNGFEIQYDGLTQRQCQGILGKLGTATPNTIRVWGSRGPQYLVPCEPNAPARPGFPACSPNGSLRVTLLNQTPGICGTDNYVFPMSPTIAFDACSEGSNRLQLQYFPAPGLHTRQY